MTRSEKIAIQIVSTVLVVSIGSLVLDFNFISVGMWSALRAGGVIKWSVLGVLVLGVTAYASRLVPDNRVLKFSIFKLIPPLRRFADNAAVMPTYLFTPLAVAYMLVLTYALPIITFWEEWYFRGKITGLASAAIVTVVFALIHFLVGASLGGSLLLVIPGSFFALVYSLQGSYNDGLIASTYLHIFYDVVAIIFVAFEVRKTRKNLAGQPAEAVSI